jgi:hypothetical protein
MKPLVNALSFESLESSSSFLNRDCFVARYVDEDFLDEL